MKALTASTAPVTTTQARNAAGEFVTVGVEKFKLWWYVILRALREYCSNHKGLDEGWETRWADRLRKRNRDYMKLPTGFLAMWYTATAQFIAWFLDRKLPKQVSEPSCGWVLGCATQPLEFLLCAVVVVCQVIGIGASGRGMGNVFAQFLKENPKVSVAWDEPEVRHHAPVPFTLFLPA